MTISGNLNTENCGSGSISLNNPIEENDFLIIGEAPVVAAPTEVRVQFEINGTIVYGGERNSEEDGGLPLRDCRAKEPQFLFWSANKEIEGKRQDDTNVSSKIGYPGDKIPTNLENIVFTAEGGVLSKISPIVYSYDFFDLYEWIEQNYPSALEEDDYNVFVVKNGTKTFDFNQKSLLSETVTLILGKKTDEVQSNSTIGVRTENGGKKGTPGIKTESGGKKGKKTFVKTNEALGRC